MDRVENGGNVVICGSVRDKMCHQRFPFCFGNHFFPAECRHRVSQLSTGQCHAPNLKFTFKMLLQEGLLQRHGVEQVDACGRMSENLRMLCVLYQNSGASSANVWSTFRIGRRTFINYLSEFRKEKPEKLLGTDKIWQRWVAISFSASIDITSCWQCTSVLDHALLP